MNSRREPYIGMPILLSECGDAMPACHGDCSMPPLPQSAPVREAFDDARRSQHMQPHPHPQQSSQPQQPQSPQQPMMLAMAYVPWQRWQTPMDLDAGLQTGTIFSALDLPFLGCQGGMRR